MIQFCKNNMQSEIQINEKRYYLSNNFLVGFNCSIVSIIWCKSKRTCRTKFISGIQDSYTYTLKNVAKTWEVDVARSMNDRNVLIPPLRTAGPILFKAWTDLSCLVPKVRKYIKLEKNKSWLVTSTNTNILLLHYGPTQVKFPLLSWSTFWFRFPAYF